LSRFSNFFGGSLQKKQNEYQQMKNQYSGNGDDLDKMKRGGNKTNQEKRGEFMQNKYANPYKRHKS
jgi:hypothetical protein